MSCAVHRQHDVARDDARGFGGRAVDGRDDGELSILGGNIRADALERAFQRAGLLFGHIGRKEDRVVFIAQRGEHPLDGTIGHGLEVNLVTVHEVFDDQVPGLPKDAELGGRLTLLRKDRPCGETGQVTGDECGQHQ